MTIRENRPCYKNSIAPTDREQNCAMWDFDYFGRESVYIRSIQFRGLVNMLAPIMVFGFLTSATKFSFFEGMRQSFLGSSSIHATRFLAPVIVFKKSLVPYLNDKLYDIFGEDQIFKLSKDINWMIDNACSIEFILNWLGECCVPYPKEDKKDEHTIQEKVAEQYKDNPNIIGDIIEGATNTAEMLGIVHEEVLETLEETIEGIQGIMGDESEKKEGLDSPS